MFSLVNLFSILLLLCSFCVHGRYVGSDWYETLDENPHSHPTFKQLLSEFIPKNKAELETNYWRSNARRFVQQQQAREDNQNVAKNLILFIGDGMSMVTQAVTRVYLGGEEQELSFEKFPHLALSKTYCVNTQVADSACTSTAYQCGVKTNKGTIGVNANVPRYHCDAGLNKSYHVRSIGDWATVAGKDIGLVTTTRVTHASPVGLYGKIANRDWENDAEVLKDGCDSSKIDDLAEQLVHGDTGLKMKVIFGGGRRNFLNSTVEDEEGEKGKRVDGRNLIDEWKRLPIGKRTYIWNKQQLKDLDVANTDHVLGLFASSHCPYQLEIDDDGLQDEKPTLSDMVDKAIEILSKNPKGFYLFVEGGRIDHAHHDNYARHSLEETVQFSKAIELATKKLSSSDTLFVATADHSHVLSYAGYSKRGNDVLGETSDIAEDSMKYKTLNYGNGPGYYVNFNQTEGVRVDPEKLDQFSKTLRYPATIPLDQDTHGGDDVGVYALGPYSHLFKGVIEQHMIPHAMAYAACIGDGLTAC